MTSEQMLALIAAVTERAKTILTAWQEVHRQELSEAQIQELLAQANDRALQAVRDWEAAQEQPWQGPFGEGLLVDTNGDPLGPGRTGQQELVVPLTMQAVRTDGSALVPPVTIGMFQGDRFIANESTSAISSREPRHPRPRPWGPRIIRIREEE
jgi:hypothetical protein